MRKLLFLAIIILSAACKKGDAPDSTKEDASNVGLIYSKISGKWQFNSGSVTYFSVVTDEKYLAPLIFESDYAFDGKNTLTVYKPGTSTISYVASYSLESAGNVIFLKFKDDSGNARSFKVTFTDSQKLTLLEQTDYDTPVSYPGVRSSNGGTFQYKRTERTLNYNHN